MNYREKSIAAWMWQDGRSIDAIARRLDISPDTLETYLSSRGWFGRRCVPSLPKVKFLDMPDPLQGTGV